MSNADDIKRILGKAVMELRTHNGLTQEQLAEKLQLTPHTITMIETGKTFVSCDVISQLCNVFNISPSVLFTPQPHITYKDHSNYLNEIIKLLPGFSKERLKEIYNILVVLNK